MNPLEMREITRAIRLLTIVLDDAESQHPGGWGLDVTRVQELRETRDTLEFMSSTCVQHGHMPGAHPRTSNLPGWHSP